MIHVTCRLTAKNRDQLRNPTLGNRVWATFLTYNNPWRQILHLKLFMSQWNTCCGIRSISCWIVHMTNAGVLTYVVFFTRCLHFTAGCTTGWVNYANEPSQAALERSSQDAQDVMRLTRSKAAVWTVDDVARSIERSGYCYYAATCQT